MNRDRGDAQDVMPQRRIRSFVLRTGRMTLGQRKALEDQWSSKGLELSDGVLDIQAAFGRAAPVVLEIGFGMGHSLVEMASVHSEKNFIGIEVHTPGVGKLLQLAEEGSVNNIRVYSEDAIEVLNQCIPDESLDELLLFFPDPWHKRKHHKRRIVSSMFADLVRTKLKKQGVLHMATDWEPYAKYMLKVMTAQEGYDNIAGEGLFSERPESRPVTKFEKRGERLGHGVWDLHFRKVVGVS